MTRETLKLRAIGIDTYHENVAYLHRGCDLYRAEGFQALSKIEVSATTEQKTTLKEGNGNRILAVLNVVDDDSIVNIGEIGLSLQAFKQLQVKEGCPVQIDHAEPPKSMSAVRRKINGERLSAKDFLAISLDIADNRYSKMEMAAFLVASGQTGLDRDEILYLTRAMLDSGEKLDWREQLVSDKHCIGGIPGNRTSMLVVPIVAAHGMLIPKTSSRAITSPSGTADTMEILADVTLTPEKLNDIIHQERGCLAWGGTAKLAPVDDKLISVERPLGIDSRGQMVASILAKKLAAGSNHLLIDIPVGPTAKVRHMREALALRKLFEFVGDRLDIHLEVVITDGRQPIGRGIGPVLEARDVMQVLENDPVAPSDLRQKSLQLAGRVIEFDPDVRGGQGYAIARDILDSGRAFAKMNAIITAQGRKQNPSFTPGDMFFDVTANKAGFITAIDNYQIARIASMAGAPIDKRAGVELIKKLSAPVNKGDVLYRVYTEFNANFEFAKTLCMHDHGYTIDKEKNIPTAFVTF